METVEQFLARGGKVQVIPEGVTVLDKKLLKCACGCNGIRAKHEALLDKDYTEYMMRKAENETQKRSAYYRDVE